jgi:hypothetical protein
MISGEIMDKEIHKTNAISWLIMNKGSFHLAVGYNPSNMLPDFLLYSVHVFRLQYTAISAGIFGEELNK